MSATTAKAAELSSAERDVLLARLRAYVTRWRVGEDERRVADRKGARFYRDDMWADGITPGRMPITSNVGKELFERVVAMVTRADPEPNVEAVNPDDDEKAAVLNGALRSNWRRRRMQELLKLSYRLSGFTRPVGWYTYWRSELYGGIGDFDTRIIPGHRLIVDDRFYKVQDMEFVGFTERASRAKLMMLFPNKSREIEDAAFGGAGERSPIRGSDSTGARTVDRLVSDSGGAYSGVASVRTGTRGGATPVDPIAESVDAIYLWFDDPTPQWEIRPKRDDAGKPVWEFVQSESGEPEFEHHGDEVVDGPLGPIYMPVVVPKMAPATERVLTRKYKHRRHVAYIPQDDVVLWDVAWNGPVPIAVQRDTYPLEGFHSRGSALSLCSLGVARNILLTIIFERLKLSLGGTWMATPGSGLKKNKLVPEPGVVFMVNNLDQVKEFPISPLDAAYFSLLDKIEQEMQMLLGLSSPMMGEAAGRADSPQTYETLVGQGGVRVVDRAQTLIETVRDWCDIGLWFVQNYYTHEHIVEVEYSDGTTGFEAASALATRGEFAVDVEASSTLVHSRSAEFQEAKDAAALGFYALPMLGKMGRIKHWRAALKQRAAIMAKGPQFSWLLGAAAATPSQPQALIRSEKHRSHHVPGSGR